MDALRAEIYKKSFKKSKKLLGRKFDRKVLEENVLRFLK